MLILSVSFQLPEGCPTDVEHRDSIRLRPEFADVGQIVADVGQHLTQFSQHWPNLANTGQFETAVGQTLARHGPTRPNFGPIRTTLAELGQMLASVGQSLANIHGVELGSNPLPGAALQSSPHEWSRSFASLRRGPNPRGPPQTPSTLWGIGAAATRKTSRSITTLRHQAESGGAGEVPTSRG